MPNVYAIISEQLGCCSFRHAFSHASRSLRIQCYKFSLGHANHTVSPFTTIWKFTWRVHNEGVKFEAHL